MRTDDKQRRGRSAAPAKDLAATVLCAEMLKALGDKNRLTVIQELLQGDKHVYELNEVIQIEPNLLSHHLKVLRHAGLVESVRDGKAVLYSLAPGIGMKRKQGLDLGCCKIQFEL